MSGARFLVHEAFREQYVDFILHHSEASDSLITQLRKSRDNPASGSPLRRIANPALQGKLFKIWIKGPGGFRYVYLYEASASAVLPVFLSPVSRAKFDWDTAPWSEIAERIVADLRGKDWAQFIEMRL